MENALEAEIMAFRHDLNKMDSSVKQLLAVANNQLRSVSISKSVFYSNYDNVLYRTKI